MSSAGRPGAGTRYPGSADPRPGAPVPDQECPNPGYRRGVEGAELKADEAPNVAGPITPLTALDSRDALVAARTGGGSGIATVPPTCTDPVTTWPRMKRPWPLMVNALSVRKVPAMLTLGRGRRWGRRPCAATGRRAEGRSQPNHQPRQTRGRGARGRVRPGAALEGVAILGPCP